MAKTTEELLEQALEQNSELTKQVGSLTDQIQALTEQVAYLTRKLYGSHSEKLVDPNQLSLLEDSSVFTDPEQTVWVKLIFFLDHASQTIDAATQVGLATDQINAA